MSKCRYCEEEIQPGNMVRAKSSKKELTFCSWRCLRNWLVEVYNTGRHYEEGLGGR